MVMAIVEADEEGSGLGLGSGSGLGLLLFQTGIVSLLASVGSVPVHGISSKPRYVFTLVNCPISVGRGLLVYWLTETKKLAVIPVSLGR